MNLFRKDRMALALLAGTLCAGLATSVALGAQTPAQPVPGAMQTGDLIGSGLRMVVSLAAVLAVVAGLAWVAQRLRNGGHLKTGLIEIISGVSLGTREKVVLLRVGQEQVLVGISPSGMRTLHVIRNSSAATPAFSDYMEPRS